MGSGGIARSLKRALSAPALVARDVHRFQPIRLALKDIEMIHGVNERLGVEDLHAMAEFYARLMATTAG